MFNCIKHGWSHVERECPCCFRIHTTTSNSTTFIIPDSIVGINKSEFDRLKAENARYLTALLYYASCSLDTDWASMGWNDNYGNKAREALKGGE